MWLASPELLVVAVLVGLATLASVVAYSINIRAGIEDVDDRGAELEAQIATLPAEREAEDYLSQVSIEVTGCDTDIAAMTVLARAVQTLVMLRGDMRREHVLQPAHLHDLEPGLAAGADRLQVG
jgi:hypothetical protein